MLPFCVIILISTGHSIERLMNMQQIYCVGFSGKSITDEVARLLFFSAQSMFQNGKEKLRLKSNFATGQVSTKFEQGLLGSVAGYVFDAQVDSVCGSTKVKFLVRPADIELLKDPDQWRMADGSGGPLQKSHTFN